MKYALLLAVLLLPLAASAQRYAAWVRKDTTWTLIDTAGNIIPETQWPAEGASAPVEASDSVLAEGIWVAPYNDGGKQFYRYREAASGKVLHEGFDLAEPFKGGYAMVMTGDAINAIDRQGSLLLRKPIPYMHAFNDAAAIFADRILVLAPAIDKACNCYSARALFGYVTRENKVVIEPLLLDADIFVAGRAKASEDARHYGFLGLDGDWAIEPVYDEVGRFFLLP